MMGIQVAGVILMAVMGYMTFLYYKKSVLSKSEAVFFITIWGMTAYITLFPESISVLSNRLWLIRKMDFVLVVGIAFSVFLSFLAWLQQKQVRKQIEKLVDQKTETKWIE